ncbi:cell division protein SepF [Murimonas intestini]|uniref:Cell division protein SepF n=1 Tax=Murimonas intestini TaxID=1337051 RepID=A0AB73TAC3_9FIRM|nr:cell division protein SepF [Murimonas intestini]MCR1839051.1 cell division protein SepF [Murimonas intestini]MCR1864347.1 cell division protein SepF [Murimonas intestini]MCR1881957.1 cell division protein SepF [Murimonas intestini]
MGVLDKFLNAMKLNDDDDFDDDDFLDDDIEDEYEEERPKKRLFKKLEEEEEYDDDDYEYDEPVRKSKQQPKQQQPKMRPVKMSSTTTSSKVSPMRPRKASGGMEVCVIKPRSMEDAREITETLLANCTVVLNMEGLDLDIAQRIIDFSSGSCYAISGNLQKVSNYIFIITPASVDISGDVQEILTGAFDVPAIHTSF